MKKLVKLSSLLLLVCCFAFFSFKSGNGDFTERLTKKLEVVKTEMNLSDQVYQQVETIVLKYAEQMKALHEQEGERQDKRDAFHKIKKAQKEELSTILTEDQMMELHSILRPRGHRGHDKMDKETRKQMKSEIHAYMEANVLPLLKRQRTQLDPAISTEDQKTIDELRALVNQHKADRKAHHEKRKAERGNKEECKGNKEGGKECRGEKKGHRAAMKANFEKAKVLADKYDAAITPLFAPIEAKMPTWKTDIKAIATKYVEDEEMANHFFERKMRHLQKKFSKIGFLIFDPNTNWDDDVMNEATIVNRHMKVFPNPSSENNSLEYEVKEAGKVRIDLYNQSGDLLRTVFEGEKSAGIHTLPIQLNSLETMTYVYTITDKSGQSSVRFVVK